jgi:hypothetical protein
MTQSNTTKYGWLNNTITDAWVHAAAQNPDDLATHAISCSALNSVMTTREVPWLQHTLELALQQDIIVDRWMHMFLVQHQMFIYHLLLTAANTPVMIWKYQCFYS